MQYAARYSLAQPFSILCCLIKSWKIYVAHKKESWAWKYNNDGNAARNLLERRDRGRAIEIRCGGILKLIIIKEKSK